MKNLLIGLLVFPVVVAWGAEPERQVYKTIGQTEFGIDIYKPEGWAATDQRPAIVFYHGGGWKGGKTDQFAEQAKHLAGRGMVAFSVQYRLSAKDKSTPVDSTKDAKSAFRWVRAHAKELGIDPNRIAAGGGSAGGHLAAALATIQDVNDSGDDLKVDAKPNALVLFNPALNLEIPDAKTRFGATPEEMLTISPFHHLDAALPKCLIFHGSGDTVVPISTIEAFVSKAKGLGADARLRVFEKRPHGFFNFGRGDGKDYEATVQEMDQFLVELGWLKSK